MKDVDMGIYIYVCTEDDLRLEKCGGFGFGGKILDREITLTWRMRRKRNSVTIQVGNGKPKEFPSLKIFICLMQSSSTI